MANNQNEKGPAFHNYASKVAFLAKWDHFFSHLFVLSELVLG